MSSWISSEDRGPVRLLSLNRPPSNGLSIAFMDAIGSEFEKAGRDPKVRSVVLASALPKYYSSGLDLDEFVANGKSPQTFTSICGVYRKILATPKPTVAAIEGYALLGGCVLAMAFDFRLMARETGRISLSEIRLGITPPLPIIRMLFAQTGRPGLIKDLVLKGKTLKAEDAFEAGLVDELLPSEGFLDACVQEADRLAKLPPKAYASVKRAAQESLIPDEDSLWKKGLADFKELFDGPEAMEGILAMQEKRKPRWS